MQLFPALDKLLLVDVIGCCELMPILYALVVCFSKQKLISVASLLSGLSKFISDGKD